MNALLLFPLVTLGCATFCALFVIVSLKTRDWNPDLIFDLRHPK